MPLFLKLSTMILILSITTCSFSGPNSVDVSLTIDLVDTDRRESAEGE
jgi:hypothetical protein